jgi:hypothetical protein
MFRLAPIDDSKAILLTESAFLKESEDYVMSVEVQNGHHFKEVFFHNILD